MRRSTAVTVCVIAGDDRRATRNFLDRIGAELGPHDNLVLCAPGRDLSDPNAWRIPAARHTLRAVTEHAPRPRPVIVIVDDRSEPGEGWLDPLLAAFADPMVGAAAPWSNVADGDELYVGVPYRPSEHGLRRAFVRELATERYATTRDAEVLAGPCLALRRDLAEELGGLTALLTAGFDPAAISTAVRARAARIVVAEGCYLHHPGGATRRPDPMVAGRPLVTACMIVKDEQVNLPSCLEAIATFADEIVVYDTGSSDATIEIAEAAGATVRRGYWDDDFGRARNDALAACRGQWILWVDADEVLVCPDPVGARARLSELPSSIEAYIVLIDNLNGTEAAVAVTHPACRLFRRAFGHWQGHLHELIVAREGNPELDRVMYNDARITHSGYLQSAINARSKGTRNLRTAFGDLAGGSELDWGFRLTSLGRSYAVVGQFAEAIDHCLASAAIAINPSTKRLALRTVIDCRLALGQLDEVLPELKELWAIPGSELLASLLEGRARQAMGEHERALECFAGVRDAVDDDGFEYTRSMVAVERATSLRVLGRPDEAADALITSLVVSGGADAHLGLIIEILDEAGRPLSEIYEALGPSRIEPFVPQLLQLQADAADRALEAWHACDANSRRLLAAAATVAPKLEIARQLVWSARLRTAGLPGSCPLVASAASATTAPRDRVLAAAAAVTMFDDARARLAFGAAVCALPEADRAPLRAEVVALAPGLATPFDQLGSSRPGGRRYEAAPAARRILVVDREIGTLRSAVLATRLAACGHAVTLVHPLPVVLSSALLDPFGVVVRGWSATATTDDGWISECDRALAWCTAEQPFDVVVLARSAAPLIPTVRSLLPRADVVLDLDAGDRLPEHADLVDAYFTSRPVRLGRPAATVATLTSLVLPRRVAVPLEARCGVLVVDNLRAASREVRELIGRDIAPILQRACEGIPLAIGGDDPDRVLAGALVRAVPAGALADPTPWLAAARVVLVTHGDGAEQWLSAAHASGTPALVAPADAARSEEIAAAVRALATDDTLWRQFAPSSAEDAALDAAPLEDLLAVLPARPPAPRRAGPGRPEVRIVGGAYSYESLPQMNRELATHLVAAKPPFDVTMSTRELEPYPADSVRALVRVKVLHGNVARPADLEIRHQWPPNFSPPAAGKLVIWQPWEYGGLPAEWIAPIRDVLAEFWVPTSWQRDCAVRSGVSEEHVQVVPYGVDTTRFCPDGHRYPLRTTKRTKLLFVGGLIERKGIDALLEAYLSSFRADDDVCLVIKPFGSHSVYRGSSLEREVRQAAGGSGPEIELVDEELNFAQMADLYRSCDALVHPYRGEGFGMPIAEAMASGLPVIVPNGGAALDFCSERTAWLVPAREVPIVSAEWHPSMAGSWWLEPSRAGLGEALRDVVDSPELAKYKGAEGRRRIVEAFTWDHVAARVAERVGVLLEGDLGDERVERAELISR